MHALPYPVDGLDMGILGRLLDNCREPDRQIGRKLGISGGAVRARIKKMEEAGVIRGFVVRVEPSVLGYGILYVVVTGQNTSEILGQVRQIGEPFFVVPCVGGITVCSIVVEGDVRRKTELASEIMSDVRVLSMFEAEDPGFAANLTRTDLEILGSLISDPRKKAEAVARDTGMSARTVARSMEKMHGNDGIRFTLTYDPEKLGGFIPHAVLAWIDGDLGSVLSRLNSRFSGSYMQEPFLAKNQIVLFMYSDSIFGMDALTQRVRSVPGVSSADLFIPKRISFYTKWLRGAIRDAKGSPRLHVGRQAG